ncbi:MAG: SIS domain-containing protein [Chloroflexi bacterium]|nr:SIS domain-containing protein [Chloroflexota bacterium]
MTAAKQGTPRYYQDLDRAIGKIVVTRDRGRRLAFARGIEAAIEMVLSIAATGGKLVFIGNGGSAAIASHQAVDFWKNGGIPALAFNDPSLLTCLSNDCGYENVFQRPIEMFAAPGDLLVAISSSGRSPNILNGVTAGRLKQCRVITLSGFGEENPLRAMGDLNFYVPTISYGYTEIIHLSICHCILDTIMESRKKGKSPGT